jgi:hypothetical protein
VEDEIVGSCCGGVLGGVWVAAGEEENFEDILESHEFRRELPSDGGCFPTLPLSVAVLSEEPLLAKLGLGVGIGFGLEGVSTGIPLPFVFPFPFPVCAKFGSFSGFVTTGGDGGFEL